MSKNIDKSTERCGQLTSVLFSTPNVVFEASKEQQHLVLVLITMLPLQEWWFVSYTGGDGSYSWQPGVNRRRTVVPAEITVSRHGSAPAARGIAGTREFP